MPHRCQTCGGPITLNTWTPQPYWVHLAFLDGFSPREHVPEPVEEARA